MNLDDAYAACTAITRREAKNFAYGIRLLPPAKRNAMSALYAYARRIDDVADGDAARDIKAKALDALDEEITTLSLGVLPDDTDPVLVGVHDAVVRFGVPVEAFAEIVEGCRHDTGGARYETFADTEAYCRLVAGSVGRLSLGVFGSTDPDAPRLADQLGVALQLTNILRDIVEDREMGRIYLARADIEHFGVSPDLLGPSAAMANLVTHYAVTAESYYADGLQLLGLLDRRSRACVAAMAGIYHRLLGRIAADPAAVTRGRLSLPTSEKLWVAVCSLTVGRA